MTDKKPGIVTLETPIKRGDEVITEIIITKPNSGAYRGVALTDLLNMDVNALLKVLPRVTTPSLTEHELTLKVDSVDLVQMGAELLTFLVPRSTLAAYQQG